MILSGSRFGLGRVPPPGMTAGCRQDRHRRRSPSGPPAGWRATMTRRCRCWTTLFERPSGPFRTSGLNPWAGLLGIGSISSATDARVGRLIAGDTRSRASAFLLDHSSFPTYMVVCVHLYSRISMADGHLCANSVNQTDLPITKHASKMPSIQKELLSIETRGWRHSRLHQCSGIGPHILIHRWYGDG